MKSAAAAPFPLDIDATAFSPDVHRLSPARYLRRRPTIRQVERSERRHVPLSRAARQISARSAFELMIFLS